MPDPTKNAIKSGGTWYPFIALSGQIKQLRMKLDEISRPGVQGTAVRKLGEQGEPFQMIGIVDCETLADAITLGNTLQGLQGSICGPLLDAYGGSAASVIVWEADVVDTQAVIKKSGGLSNNGLALLFMRFVFSIPTAS